MRLPRFPIAFPPHGTVLAALCALYLLPGLVGHDPWKGDDATHFGVVFSMLEGGHWLLPHLAGEPWLDSPPLYHWVAAVLARTLGLVLPLHDAARLATGLFAAIMIASLGGATLRFIGQEAARGAILIAIGCLGLLVHVHEVQPAMVHLAATAALYLGLALLPEHPRRGGLLAGAALGLGFLAVGLPALITLGPLLMLLPLISSHLRTPQAARGMLAALAIAAPLILAWPLALYMKDPAACAAWWGRELADLHTSRDIALSLWSFLKLLSWFAWPAIPLAAWTLWKERRRLLEPRTLIPLTSFVILLAVQSVFSEPRSLNALPLLPPLILLAAPATLSLRRGAANSFDWFGMMLFTLLASLVWLGWTAMTTGVPLRLAKNFARLVPDFTASFSLVALAAALVLTLGWLWLVFTSPRFPQRGTVHWAAGLTLCWGLLMALWLPMIELDRSYRKVAVAIKAALPQGEQCIVGRGLGSTQRASFHYFAGIRTLKETHPSAGNCKLYLSQGTTQKETLPPGTGWRKIWEGGRPSDRFERFRLYVRK